MNFAPSISPLRRLRHARRGAAFTLMEMLTVVALVGILAAFVGFSVSGGSRGELLAGGQRSLLGMVEMAIANAKLQGTRARLLVFSDRNFVSPTSASAGIINDKVLRYFGVVYAASDDPTVPAGTVAGLIKSAKPYNVWIAANGGAYLPEGVFFVPQHQSSFAQNIPNFASNQNAITDQYFYPVLSSMDDHCGTTTGVMQLQFPVSQAAEGLGDWYYFVEFAPDGYFYNTNGNNNIIIGVGEYTGSGSINFMGTENALFSGVQIRTLGGVSPFRSISDLQNQ